MPELTTAECPEEKVLSDFLLGKLDPTTSSECESHLSVCKPCVDTISALDISDTFQSLVVDSASEQLQDLSEADESIVGNLVHRLSVLSTKTRKAEFDQRAVEVVRLLEPIEEDGFIGQIDDYKIEKVLGAGSSGVVFRAFDQNLDRFVAIKILRPTLGDAARSRFMAEARATANLDHPNIVTIYHVGISGSLAYIVMQWLPGETLERRLEREHVLAPETVKDLGIQFANGLSVAHEMSLVHRDIKPANLWISENGPVKILDFGLVRIMDETPQLTCTGMIAGTPCYMSPEQSRGDELDARSDLFSLGCVMYQCLTGKLPFESTNALATLQAIQREQPTPPASLDSSISSELSDLVMVLLEKSPHRRPASSVDLEHALKNSRSDWRFKCRDYSSDFADVVATKPIKSKLSPWRAAVIALTVGCLSFGGWVFGPQIFRIVTDQGEIVIETNDPNVQVEVSRGGELIEVIDLRTKQNLFIKSGTYEVKATGGENSFSINKDSLVLKRGETAIVTVTKNIDDSAAKNSVVPKIQNRGNLSAENIVRTSPQLSIVDPNHVLAPGDVLFVSVEDVVERSGNAGQLSLEVNVMSDGTISLPLLNTVKAAGKTALLLENELREKYKMFIAPERIFVSVSVREVYASSKSNLLTKPVYAGMTFEGCRNVLKFERNGRALVAPFLALLELNDAPVDNSLLIELLDANVLIRRAYQQGPESYICKDAEDTFVGWMTKDQFQFLVSYCVSSEKSGHWDFVARNLNAVDWNFKSEGQDETVLGKIVSAIGKHDDLEGAPSSVIAQLLLSKIVPVAILDQHIDAIVERSHLSFYQAYLLEKVVRNYPDHPELGHAVSVSVKSRKERNVNRWINVYSEMSQRNKKQAVGELVNLAFSRDRQGDLPWNTLVRIPDAYLELVKPEFAEKIQAAKEERRKFDEERAAKKALRDAKNSPSR